MQAESEIDLFEHYEQCPADVREIAFDYAEQLERGDRCPYEICKEFLQDMESLGFTFEYGLDGVPYGLRPMRES